MDFGDDLSNIIIMSDDINNIIICKLLTISINISTAIPHTVILRYKLNARGLHTVGMPKMCSYATTGRLRITI